MSFVAIIHRQVTQAQHAINAMFAFAPVNVITPRNDNKQSAFLEIEQV
jgi:hypothetical protein